MTIRSLFLLLGFVSSLIYKEISGLFFLLFVIFSAVAMISELTDLILISSSTKKNKMAPKVVDIEKMRKDMEEEENRKRIIRGI